MFFPLFVLSKSCLPLQTSVCTFPLMEVCGMMLDLLGVHWNLIFSNGAQLRKVFSAGINTRLLQRVVATHRTIGFPQVKFYSAVVRGTSATCTTEEASEGLQMVVSNPSPNCPHFRNIHFLTVQALPMKCGHNCQARSDLQATFRW